MKFPRLRLAYVLELVVAVAVGLYFARLNGRPWVDMMRPRAVASIAVYRDPDWFVAVEALLRGIGLVGGLGLVLELRRGRPGGDWGRGRWTWGFVCFQTLAMWAIRHLESVRWGMTMRVPFQWVEAQRDYAVSISRGGMSNLGIYVAAAYLAFALGGRRVRPGTGVDDREWCGQFYGFLLIGWALVDHAQAMGL